MTQNANVIAIIVTYFPQSEPFLELIGSLSLQVGKILVVDNTPAKDDRTFTILAAGGVNFDQIRIVRLGWNAGIATALNVGIAVALAEGFSYVLLSDQDSLPASDMVIGLMRSYRDILSQGHRVAGVGPLVHDLITQQNYPFQTRIPGKVFYGHQFPTEDRPYISATSLITSGMFIPTDVLRETGNMYDDFFIDHVDVEWCHRVLAKGYVIFGTGQAVLYHRMGDGCIRVWYFGWRNINEYSPLRLYYRFRNFTYLLRLAYIPILWKIRASWYWAGIFYSHFVFSSKKIESLRAVAIGVWDGILGKLGASQRF